MSDTFSGKKCRICGADCAGKPRTKDARGNYYCKPCHDEALRKREAKQREAAAEPDPGTMLEPVDEGMSFGMPDMEFDVPLDVPEPDTCVKCGVNVPTNAVLCTNCGYDFRTGEQMTIAPPPTSSGSIGGGHARKGPIWHIPIGVISIVLGAGGAIYALISALPMLTGGDGNVQFGAGWMATAAIALMFFLALWLLMGGIGVVRQQSTAVPLIRRWAIWKLVIFGTCFSCITGSLLIASSNLPSENGAAVSLGIGIMAAMFLWILAWPIFILVWFGRDKIKQDVNTWR